MYTPVGYKVRCERKPSLIDGQSVESKRYGPWATHTIDGVSSKAADLFYLSRVEIKRLIAISRFLQSPNKISRGHR